MESREALLPFCEKVELPVRHTLVEPNKVTDFAYFLESGLASIVAASRLDETTRIEVGHIGSEGMAGIHLLLGVDQTPNHTFMQVAGTGWRISSQHLHEAMEDDKPLRAHLLRYVQTYQLQLAYSALANGRYTIPVRLARWLLMCHDRLETDAMPLTHEFLGLMLGVRRSGVTNEIHVLEGEHAIRAIRATIVVRDRSKLIEIAGGAYGVPEAEYARLMEGALEPA
ncbi:Crp/Fnr family transcriptional regulator [Aureimonas sp. ME7]|uniref:Crp/Fnr family transcriptional regulator n=1 Tax=Aureimonas sp. ME7 TaxID=2744252 RepID=UPI0032AF85AB